MLSSPDAHWRGGVEPSSNMLVSSRSKMQVIVISASPAAVYLSERVTSHASPKVKEKQSKPSTVSSSRSALLGPYKTVLTRKLLDQQDKVEYVTSTGT